MVEFPIEVERKAAKEFGVVLKRDAAYKLLHWMNYSWLCPRPR